VGTFASSGLNHVLTRVCVGDLVDLIGVQPDLFLAASQYGGCEPLLEL